MDKKQYITPKTKFINPIGAPLMDFNVGGSEPGEDFEFAKEGNFDDNNEAWTEGHSVWED